MRVQNVQKRDGSLEEVSFDKVLRRVRNLSEGLDGIDPYKITQDVNKRIYDGIKTSELDELAAQTCATMVTEHPDYGRLSSRIIVSNHHKNTSPSFSETIAIMYGAKDIHGKPNPLITDEVYSLVQLHKEKLNSVIDYQRDYTLDYFGFKTLERSYLTRIEGRIVERPQHMWMRVAIGIHGADIKEAIETYDLMSRRLFTHATPTLFNAGMRNGSLASCFLLGMEDSITGIYKCLADCAQISKHAGGIGIHVHDIRARGSHIRGTNGKGTGLVPMLRVYNNTARYVNQGSKRAGSIAVYLEPWHADVEAFLDLRKNHGSEEERCRDLFLALWIPDLFMKRVESNGDWCLMCPDECRGLTSVYGKEFDELYLRYEAEGKYRKKVKAQQLWIAILKAQVETGAPYLLYKDAANSKSNQQNIGTIKSSNLCSEIIEYSDDKEYAMCNLASIALASFVKDGEFDFEQLHAVAKTVAKNINKVIDRTHYTVPETKVSNLRHRPIGMGVQGLADTYAMLRMPFDSPEAAKLNREIFETIYHGAVEASMEIARKRHLMVEEMRAPDTPPARVAEIRAHLSLISEEEALTQFPGAYATFAGSPASKGLLQFDLWDAKPEGKWDWASLKAEIAKYGLRNSLLLAPMPTASTSQILGYTECFEPITSNIFTRRTLAGEFTIINKYLVQDLLDMGMWNPSMKDRIIAGGGSIQDIEEIPEMVRTLYKTAWEMRQKVLIDQAADRGIYVCQSQSLNLFVEDPEFTKLTNMHFYAWKRGLKTGCYYLRTRPRAKTMAFTIDPRMAKGNLATAAATPTATTAAPTCTTDGECLMCSS